MSTLGLIIRQDSGLRRAMRAKCFVLLTIPSEATAESEHAQCLWYSKKYHSTGKEMVGDTVHHSFKEISDKYFLSDVQIHYGTNFLMLSTLQSAIIWVAAVRNTYGKANGKPYPVHIGEIALIVCEIFKSMAASGKPSPYSTFLQHSVLVFIIWRLRHAIVNLLAGLKSK